MRLPQNSALIFTGSPLPRKTLLTFFLTFKSMDEILCTCPSNETSLITLLHGSISFLQFFKNTFEFFWCAFLLWPLVRVTGLIFFLLFLCRS